MITFWVCTNHETATGCMDIPAADEADEADAVFAAADAAHTALIDYMHAHDIDNATYDSEPCSSFAAWNGGRCVSGMLGGHGGSVLAKHYSGEVEAISDAMCSAYGEALASFEVEGLESADG